MGGELQVDASAISYYLSRTTTDKSGEMVSAALCTKLLPTIIYVSWEFTLVALGIYAFLYVSVVSNVAGFTLFFAHEAYLGRKLGWDYTLMSELTLRGGGSGAMGPGPFSPPLPHTPPSMGQQGVDAAQQATYPQQYNGADPGATDFSSGALSKEYAEEYEKIMQRDGHASKVHMNP